MLFFDSPGGEFVLAIPEDLDNPRFSRRAVVRFGSPAEVQPILLPHVERSGSRYVYSYTIQNGPRARISIDHWRLAIPLDDSPQPSRPGWEITRGRSGTTLGFPGPFGYAWLEWSAQAAGAFIPKNGMQGPFLIESDAAPGFTEFWARGSVNRQYTEELTAALPPEVAASVSKIAAGAARGRLEITIGPWFPPGTERSTIVRNFKYGLSHLANTHRLDHHSPFVVAAMAALDGYFQSGETATFFEGRGLDFLSLAAPGLETEIANALRMSLSR